METQAAFPLVLDKSPQGCTRCPAATVLQEQDIKARQAGLFGEPVEIGKQIPHFRNPLRVGDHPDDQVRRRLDRRRGARLR